MLVQDPLTGAYVDSVACQVGYIPFDPEAPSLFFALHQFAL